ncbi:hypothetical protein ACVBEG_26750 [Pseudomonas sp. GG8]
MTVTHGHGGGSGDMTMVEQQGAITAIAEATAVAAMVGVER